MNLTNGKHLAPRGGILARGGIEDEFQSKRVSEEGINVPRALNISNGNTNIHNYKGDHKLTVNQKSAVSDLISFDAIQLLRF